MSQLSEPDHLRIAEQALRVLEARFGPDHPRTMAARDALARRLVVADRLSEAIELLQKSVILRQQLLGNGHPDTLMSVNTLALTLARAGRLDEAKAYMQQALDLAERSIGRKASAARDIVQKDAFGILSAASDPRGPIQWFTYSDLTELLRRAIEARKATNDSLAEDGQSAPSSGRRGRGVRVHRRSATSWRRADSGDPEPALYEDSLPGTAGNEPSLDDLFASHAARVVEILDDSSHEPDEADLDAPSQFSTLDPAEAQRLVREAREAVNNDLISLFLKLGPPPDSAGRDDYEPVNSGGGGTRE